MMEPPRLVSPYDILLSETSRGLFKSPISPEEGLAALEAYVKADFTWLSVKPFRKTWDYKRSVSYKHARLVEALEELHGRQKIEEDRSLALDDVVAVAYQQSNPLHQRAILLLGHEFGFYTITEQANNEYFFGSDTHQSIALVVTKMEEAKAANIPASEVMSYILPVIFREEPPLTDAAIFEPIYTTGIAAVLEGRTEDLKEIIRDHKPKLGATSYRNHIAFSLLGAHHHNMRLFPQAIASYEKSLNATPADETGEPIYAHSVTALLELYAMSPAYTTRIATLYPKAKAAGIALNETLISEKVAFVAGQTAMSYHQNLSETDVHRLDSLLDLAEIPLVRNSLATAYTSMMRQALDDKNIDHAKHCRDKIAALSQNVPFEDELREGIQERILDAVALDYEFVLLQYQVGAVGEAAKALDGCRRVLKTGGAGALHLLTAQIRRAQGDNDAALASLEAAVAADFSDARYNAKKIEARTPLVDLGCIYHTAGDRTRAENAFRLAATVDPLFDSKEYLQVAQESYAAGNLILALHEIERIAVIAQYVPSARETMNTDILKLLNTIGVTYKDGKETGKNLATAKRAFSASLSLEPTHVDAHYHLGTIAMMEKENTLAVDHLRQVVEQNPRHSWGQYQLGLAYQRAGEETLSQHHLHTAAALGHKQAQALLK